MAGIPAPPEANPIINIMPPGPFNISPTPPIPSLNFLGGSIDCIVTGSFSLETKSCPLSLTKYSGVTNGTSMPLILIEVCPSIVPLLYVLFL